MYDVINILQLTLTYIPILTIKQLTIATYMTESNLMGAIVKYSYKSYLF